MAEPSGEDEPQVSLVPDEENLRGEAFSRFGTYIGLSAFPGNRNTLERSARDLDAPDDVLDGRGSARCRQAPPTRTSPRSGTALGQLTMTAGRTQEGRHRGYRDRVR